MTICSGPFTLTPEMILANAPHLCARTRSTVEGDLSIYGSEVTLSLVLAELGIVGRIAPMTGLGSVFNSPPPGSL